jgi:hypothetical protein
MPARAALAFALDHPLQAQEDPGALRRAGFRSLREVDVAGDLQRRHLARIHTLGFPGFQEGRYFPTK